MLNVVVGVSIAAFLALVVALVSGSVLFGWITVAASAAGLLLLIVNELRHDRGADTELQRDVSARPREEIVTPHAEEPTVAGEVEYDGAMLKPDIWPPDHPAEQTRGADDHAQPRPRREGEAPRPDIWP
jgi:uncharacterized protein (DUF58 family)